MGLRGHHGSTSRCVAAARWIEHLEDSVSSYADSLDSEQREPARWLPPPSPEDSSDEDPSARGAWRDEPHARYAKLVQLIPETPWRMLPEEVWSPVERFCSNIEVCHVSKKVFHQPHLPNPDFVFRSQDRAWSWGRAEQLTTGYNAAAHAVVTALR
ncbi:unnamed protein product [Polarella glacialis]|uniref:Uncharacterized protein n=1 Tax=Polarella glacialis TaxID=89957 RepID=A0A813KRQ3_POLGL|nr:unnamed protein product [Polarella glacialis]